VGVQQSRPRRPRLHQSTSAPSLMPAIGRRLATALPPHARADLPLHATQRENGAAVAHFPHRHGCKFSPEQV